MGTSRPASTRCCTRPRLWRRLRRHAWLAVLHGACRPRCLRTSPAISFCGHWAALPTTMTPETTRPRPRGSMSSPSCLSSSCAAAAPLPVPPPRSEHSQRQHTPGGELNRSESNVTPARCSGYTRRHIAMARFLPNLGKLGAKVTRSRVTSFGGKGGLSQIASASAEPREARKARHVAGARTASRPPSPLALDLFASAGRVRSFRRAAAWPTPPLRQSCNARCVFAPRRAGARWLCLVWARRPCSGRAARRRFDLGTPPRHCGCSGVASAPAAWRWQRCGAAPTRHHAQRDVGTLGGLLRFPRGPKALQAC